MMLMALYMSVTSFAQGIKGTVIDENGEPVIGATVAEKSNPKNATITDFDGNFTVNVNAGKIIQITYIGYETQEAAAKNGMTIKLRPDNKVLDEVVVVGYGVQKKSSVTGVISQVKPEVMENRTIAPTHNRLCRVRPLVCRLSSRVQPLVLHQPYAYAVIPLIQAQNHCSLSMVCVWVISAVSTQAPSHQWKS